MYKLLDRQNWKAWRDTQSSECPIRWEPSDNVIAILKGAGIKCCRTTLATGKFHLPNDFLAWHPTCHHRNMLELLPQFLDCRYALSIFFVWGHAYEFPRNDNWGDMESFCKQISGKQEIWYATNIEICRYLTAMYQLEISVDGSLIYNPTATEIWFTANGNLMSIKAGQSIKSKPATPTQDHKTIWQF